MASMDFSLSSLSYIQKIMFFFILPSRAKHSPTENSDSPEHKIHKRHSLVIIHLCCPWNWLVHRKHSFNEQIYPCSATNVIPWPPFCPSRPKLSILKKNLHLFYREVCFHKPMSGETELFTELLHGLCSVTSCLWSLFILWFLWENITTLIAAFHVKFRSCNKITSFSLSILMCYLSFDSSAHLTK